LEPRPTDEPRRHVDRFAERKRERFLSEAELARLGKALAEAEHARTEAPRRSPHRPRPHGMPPEEILGCAGRT
jgi:hypothetical protein